MILLSLCFCFSSTAQVKDAAYDFMLKGLYKNTVPVLTGDKLKELKSYVLLDTREKPEYDVSHIPQAKWVGYKSFNEDEIDPLPKDTTIVVYCSVGYRSERIGERLQEMGFTRVYNLYGGIFEWVNNGYELVDDERNATDKVHAYSKTWGIWLSKGAKVY